MTVCLVKSKVELAISVFMQKTMCTSLGLGLARRKQFIYDCYPIPQSSVFTKMLFPLSKQLPIYVQSLYNVTRYVFDNLKKCISANT